MFLGSKDKELEKRMERAQKRKCEEEKRRQRAKEKSEALTSVAIVNDDDISDAISDSDEEFKMPQAKSPKSVPATQLYSSHVTAALDRSKASDRAAVHLIGPVAAALGHDVSSLPLSRSTVKRVRERNRAEQGKDIKVAFQPKYPLVIHWDGQILPDFQILLAL
jgi:hypothetical protein